MHPVHTDSLWVYAMKWLGNRSISGGSIRAGIVIIVMCSLWCLPAGGQDSFDVVSVKQTPRSHLNQLKFEKCGGGRFLAAGIPIIWIVEFAYHVQEDQVVGAPSWLRSFGDAYDIEAKREGKVGEEECRPMVRTLLEDRFRIATHWEPQRMAAFALVAGRRADKLRAVTLDSPVGGVKINGGVQQSLSEPEAPSGWTMARFANYLANYAGRPVVDRTGLSGVYAFSFNFARSSQEEESHPSVFDAIQDQLGLKLKPIKADINVLVVDHIERPSAN